MQQVVGGMDRHHQRYWHMQVGRVMAVVQLGGPSSVRVWVKQCVSPAGIRRPGADVHCACCCSCCCFFSYLQSLPSIIFVESAEGDTLGLITK
jgi:hypothetical protein